jgi:retron-type reverse transcriptase
MKTYDNIYPQVYDFESLYNGYLRARKGKRHHVEVLKFERNLESELIHLQNELIWGQYKTGVYREFYVYEPKTRLVAALPFRDRVVQHSLVGAVEFIWEKRFINHSYACRPGRGMHSGALQAQKWLRKVERNHGRVYVLKADIRKYFPSINHDIILKLFARRIACKRTMKLLEEIIRSWGPGLPIGNLTSQLAANVYLHELDQHVKQDLREPLYMRYMDDWLIVHNDKKHLHQMWQHLEQWLKENLALDLNGKTQVFPVGAKNGRALDFLGYRMWTTHRRLRNGSVRRMKSRLKIMQKEYAAGKIDGQHIRNRISSWIGHAKFADTYRIRSMLLGSACFQRAANCEVTTPQKTPLAPDFSQFIMTPIYPVKPHQEASCPINTTTVFECSKSTKALAPFVPLQPPLSALWPPRPKRQQA